MEEETKKLFQTLDLAGSPLAGSMRVEGGRKLKKKGSKSKSKFKKSRKREKKQVSKLDIDFECHIIFSSHYCY